MKKRKAKTNKGRWGKAKCFDSQIRWRIFTTCFRNVAHSAL